MVKKYIERIIKRNLVPSSAKLASLFWYEKKSLMFAPLLANNSIQSDIDTDNIFFIHR